MYELLTTKPTDDPLSVGSMIANANKSQTKQFQIVMVSLNLLWLKYF